MTIPPNDTDDALDQLLTSDLAPEPDAHQIQAIVQAAKTIQQKQSLWAWLQSTFNELKLPTPAYSFIGLFLIGVISGFGFTTPDSFETTMALNQTSATSNTVLVELLYGNHGWGL